MQTQTQASRIRELAEASRIEIVTNKIDVMIGPRLLQKLSPLGIMSSGKSQRLHIRLFRLQLWKLPCLEILANRG